MSALFVLTTILIPFFDFIKKFFRNPPEICPSDLFPGPLDSPPSLTSGYASGFANFKIFSAYPSFLHKAYLQVLLFLIPEFSLHEAFFKFSNSYLYLLAVSWAFSSADILASSC